jgi:hypothetical protein
MTHHGEAAEDPDPTLLRQAFNEFDHADRVRFANNVRGVLRIDQHHIGVDRHQSIKAGLDQA